MPTNSTIPTLEVYEIKGQSYAKRALEVASVGDLRILLIGPLGSSKTTLRQAFPDVDSDEIETCPCGHFKDIQFTCACSPRAIHRWYRRFERMAKDYDIVLECCRIPAKEMLSVRKPDPQEQGWLNTRIAEARKYGESHRSVELVDDAAYRTMEMVLRRLSLTHGQYTHILRTARAIANLDGSDQLKAKHIAEAVQYRADSTTFRLDNILE